MRLYLWTTIPELLLLSSYANWPVWTFAYYLMSDLPGAQLIFLLSLIIGKFLALYHPLEGQCSFSILPVSLGVLKCTKHPSDSLQLSPETSIWKFYYCCTLNVSKENYYFFFLFPKIVYILTFYQCQWWDFYPGQ